MLNKREKIAVINGLTSLMQSIERHKALAIKKEQPEFKEIYDSQLLELTTLCQKIRTIPEGK